MLYKPLQNCKDVKLIIYLRLIRPIFKTHVPKCMSYHEAIEAQVIKIFFVLIHSHIRVKAFKNGTNKICERQPLKNLK